MKKTLAIISPVYNEAGVIDSFYRSLRAELLKLADYTGNIIFVVDKSSDGTLEILKNIAAKDHSVSVIALSSRFGHQRSLMAGIDHAIADVSIVMDSDLQHPPELIPKLLAEYEKGKDIVYTVRQDTIKISFFKRITSKMFYYVFNLLSDIKIQEGAADFYLLSSRVIAVLKTDIRERNIFLRGLIRWMGFGQSSITYVAAERRAGKSKYSLSRLVQLALSGVISFSKKPLRLASILGFIFAFLGILYALIVFIQYFTNGNLPPGWTTLTILLAVLGGVQLIFLGILGEYIGGIFDEVKRRPHYIIEEKIN